MADRIIQEIEVSAKVEDAIRKLDKLESQFAETMGDIRRETKKTNKTQKELNESVVTVGKSLKTAFTAGAVIAGIKRASVLSGEFQRTTIALQKSLADVNKEFQLENLQDFAAEMENLSGVSDEVVRQLLLVGVNSGITGEALKSLVRGSLGLASATGRDTVTMMTNLIKTLAGFKEESVKTIPEIVNLTGEQLKQGKAITEVDEKYSKFIKTLSGPEGSLSKGVTDLENGFNNFLESVGNTLGSMGLGTVLGKAGIIIERFGNTAERAFLRIQQGVLNFNGAAIAMTQALDDTLFAGLFLGGDDSLLMNQADKLAEVERKLLANAEKGVELHRRLLGDDPDPTPKIPGPIVFPKFGIDPAEQRRLDELKKQREREAEIQAQIDEAIFKARIEAEQNRQKILTEERNRLIDIGVEQNKKRIDMELDLEDFRIRELDKRLTEEENMRSRAFANMRDIAGGFAEDSIGLLFDQMNGEKKAFSEMLKNFLNATGQRLIGRGISDTLQGAAMLATGQPQGGVLMGIGAAEIAAGAAMRGGALLINTPSTATAKSAGVGGSMDTSQSETRGIASGPKETVINIFGAMTTEESAILIERGMRQAEDRGFA